MLMTDAELDQWIWKLRAEVSRRRESGDDVHGEPLYPAIVAALSERELREEEARLP
jgi:hypothetical protein